MTGEKANIKKIWLRHFSEKTGYGVTDEEAEELFRANLSVNEAVKFIFEKHCHLFQSVSGSDF